MVKQTISIDVNSRGSETQQGDRGYVSGWLATSRGTTVKNLCQGEGWSGGGREQGVLTDWNLDSSLSNAGRSEWMCRIELC